MTCHVGEGILRDKVLARIREERERCEKAKNMLAGAWPGREYVSVLSEAERQVEEHDPRDAADGQWCGGCTSFTKPDCCPVILGWARVFGIGEVE